MERNIDVQEKHGLVASGTPPNQGPGLQPRGVPLLGIHRPTFPFAEGHPNSLSYISQGCK